MAIQFQSNLLTTTNPAYNDSIISYSSDLTGMTKSDIVIGDTTFTIYPFEGQFRFNFKDIVTSLINPNGFKDTVLPNLSLGEFIYPDSTLQLTVTPQITTYNEVSGDTTGTTYTFTKSVEQLAFYNQKLDSGNDVKVLLPTTNYFDYDVTYFEGYPFDIALQGIASGDTYYFKNSNTGLVSDVITSDNGEVKRIFFSDGAYNETINGTLVMSSNVNHLELWVNDVIKANINVKRVESTSGVYLKWFNASGGYSYWLFEKFFKENIRTKDFDDVLGKWDNLQNITSTSVSLGKSAALSNQLTTNFNNVEKEYLIDILKSPKVEMFIHQSPFNQQTAFNFLGVKVADGSFNFENKNTNNKLRITIEQPNINTITY